MSDADWTVEDINVLRQLVEKTSLSFSQIAALMQRTRGQCLGKARREMFVRPAGVAR